jgi:hypothetical protein
LVALVYLIDPGVLVSLVAIFALMAFQGISDLQDRTKILPPGANITELFRTIVYRWAKLALEFLSLKQIWNYRKILLYIIGP